MKNIFLKNTYNLKLSTAIKIKQQFLFFFLLMYIIALLSFLSSCQNTIQKKNSNTETSAVTIAENTLKNTVSITMLDKDRNPLSLGSGVIIDNGVIVTNIHVINGASFGYITMDNTDRQIEIEGVLALDTLNDLALLSVPNAISNQKIIIQNTYPKVGERIYATGNPKGLAGTFSEGNVSAIRNFDNKSLVQISAPISPGSSGGAIVNQSGELVGIAVSGIADGQNLNFVIPAKNVSNLLIKKSDCLKSLSTISPTRIVKNINGSVIIKNVDWVDPLNFYNDPINYKILKEFSIYNRTTTSIKNVSIILILYDKDNLPVDYSIFNTNENDTGIIPPGLSKIFDNSKAVGENRHEMIIQLHLKKGYTAILRILDYEIVAN